MAAEKVLAALLVPLFIVAILYWALSGLGTWGMLTFWALAGIAFGLPALGMLAEKFGVK